MTNFPRENVVNELLNSSLRAVEAYARQIEDHDKSTVQKGERAPTINKDLIRNLGDLLSDTRSALQKQLQTDSVVRVDTNTLRALELAMDRLMHDASTENKVNMAHFAIYGTTIPFWNELKSLQQLLITVESLKRGRKVASIDEMEKDDQEDR